MQYISNSIMPHFSFLERPHLHINL